MDWVEASTTMMHAGRLDTMSADEYGNLCCQRPWQPQKTTVTAARGVPRGQQDNSPATEAAAGSGDADGIMIVVSREPGSGTYASQNGRWVGKAI